MSCAPGRADRCPGPDGSRGHDRLLPRRRAGSGPHAAYADVDTLAPALMGAGHLLFAGREGIPPEADAVRKMVTTVIASVVQER